MYPRQKKPTQNSDYVCFLAAQGQKHDASTHVLSTVVYSASTTNRLDGMVRVDMLFAKQLRRVSIMMSFLRMPTWPWPLLLGRFIAFVLFPEHKDLR